MSNYYLSKRSNPFDLIDPFFDAFWGGNNARTDVMRTDITDEGDHYQLKIDMPSIAKENIKISLNEGYLSITATFGDKENDKDIRQKRLYRLFDRQLRKAACRRHTNQIGFCHGIRLLF